MKTINVFEPMWVKEVGEEKAVAAVLYSVVTEDRLMPEIVVSWGEGMFKRRGIFNADGKPVFNPQIFRLTNDPFALDEEPMFDWTKPCRRKDDKTPVRIVAHLKQGRILGVMETDDIQAYAAWYTNGTSIGFGDLENWDDPTFHSGWINLPKGRRALFETREDADRSWDISGSADRGADRGACVRVVWHDGDGLTEGVTHIQV